MNRVSVAPEQVIMTQKLTCGAVQGENIMVQRTAARNTPTAGFFNDISFVILEQFRRDKGSREEHREHQLEIGCSDIKVSNDAASALY